MQADLPADKQSEADPDAPLSPGIVIVDHGSRREASNQMLLEIVQLFRDQTDFEIVEPAHMELAEPTIATAFDRCVARGADRVIVHPYFLLPGRHSREDIPQLAQQAAARHPNLSYSVTEPLGLHPLMCSVMADRIDQAMRARP